MKHLIQILDRTEFLDVVKGWHLLFLNLMNGSLFTFIVVQVKQLSDTEKTALCITIANGILLFFLGARKVIRYFVRDWFPDSDFMKDK